MRALTNTPRHRKGTDCYGAHVPDFPGCVAAAETKEEVCSKAIELYVETLEEDGLPVPTPQPYELIEV